VEQHCLGGAVFGAALFGLAAAPARSEPAPTEVDVRAGVTRALSYLEKDGTVWMRDRRCVSCHTVSFALWSQNDANRRGFAVDPARLELLSNWALLDTVGRGKEGGGLDTMAQLLLGRDRASWWRASRTTNSRSIDPFETMWLNVLSAQKEDGSWPVAGQLTSPAEISTGWALLALASRDSAPAPGDDAAGYKVQVAPPLTQVLQQIDRELPAARARAIAFLERTKTNGSTEALLVRALIEREYGDASRAAALLKELAERQNPDGGWSYWPGNKSSDAFATGQVLWGLGYARTAPERMAAARGYLLKSQRPDGSWSVPTAAVRTPQPTPLAPARAQRLDPIYGYWGSGWATIGLLATLPETPATAKR
jgi:hypothetical protein